jgi:TonB-dependent SusC/RagA subfamily outer membrane receptor
MKRILLLCSVFTFALLGEAWAQERTITGRVTSADDGSPLPGVNVTVKGTTTGTAATVDGTYQLSVPDNSTIVFSFIGLITQEVPVGNQSVINVQLRADVRQLNEVVVSGQGVGIEKRRLSTTVDVVTADQIKAIPAQRLDQVLQQAIPSAQIQLSSGQPGTASIIRARGVTSAQGSTTPVIYIDGVRVDNLNTAAALSLDTGGGQSSALADIPVENIERIEFIKGGAATTLYGSDAANGVIQIFTKKGTAGQSRINFETQLGSMVGTKDYLHFKETADYLFRPSLTQNYRIGMDGGNDNVTYSFSGNIYGDKGFRYNNDQKRYNLRTTISAKVNKRTTYTGSIGYTSNNFGRDYNANTSFSTFASLENGSYGDLSKLNAEEQQEVRETVQGIQDLLNITETVNRFQTSHAIEFKPIDKITINGTVGMDFRTSRQKEILTVKLLTALDTDDQGSIDVYDRTFKGLSGTLNAQYRENAGDFSFITTLGGQFFRNQDFQVNFSGTNVTEGSQIINNAGERTAQEYIGILTNYGFYGQENLGFKDKYFLEFGLRGDGSSAFGEEIGIQFYPKVGVAYNLSSEEFFKAIPPTIISNLKLRANYGVAGNFPPPFINQRLINVFPYNGTSAYTFGLPGDDNLKPEKTYTYEVGGDLGFLNNRITVGVTYFHATTKDALFGAPFAPSSGQDNQTRNLGEILNKGFEIASSFQIVKSDNLDLTFNASVNTIENKVLTNGGAPEFSIGGFQFLGSFVKQGLPVGYFRGNIPTFDEGGNLVSSVGNANLGSALPKSYGNSSINLTFKKRLTLFVSASYQVGSTGVNLDETLRFFNGLSDDRIPQATLDAFNEGTVNFTQLGAVWAEKTDFLKVRNISLSYRVPSQFYGNVFKNLELGFNVTNPFNFFSSTFDPEVTGSGATSSLTAGQNRVTVGGFGYGTESAPRLFLGTLRFSL